MSALLLAAGYKIALTPEETAEAVLVGTERQKTHASGSGARPWHGEENLLANHIRGAIGEKAVRKALDVPGPLNLVALGGDGGRGDIVLWSGKTVSVKTKIRGYRNTYFYYHVPHTLLDDYGVICVPAPGQERWPVERISRILALGYVTREAYEQTKYPIAVPHGETEGVGHLEMKPFADLVDNERGWP